MGKGTPPSVSWGDVALLFPQALSFAPARRRCRLPALRCGERIAFPLQPYCASREERPFPMLDPGCRQSREKGSFSPYRSRWLLKEGKLGLRWEKAALASTFRKLCFLFWGFCPCALSALPLRASLRGEAGLFPPCPSCPPHAGGGERALFPAGSGSGQSRGKGVDPLPSPTAGGAVWPLAEIRGKQHFSLRF